MRHALLRAVGTVLLSSFGFAAAPTTQPVADASTPKAALKSFAAATRTGNRDSLRASFHATTETESKLADLTADVAAAVVRLRDAAVAKFGEAGAEQFNGSIPDDSHLGRIDAAKERLEDDAATVVVEGPDGKPQPMYLVRVDGQWKISVARGLAAMPADKVESQLSALTITSKILDEVAVEITRGQYKSADEAAGALKNKVTYAFLMQAKQPRGRQARR
jgi:hypothetical protein